MNLFSRWFGKAIQSPPTMPWDNHPSIYEFIKSHGDDFDPSCNLPDEERLHSDSQIRWAAGAMDGVVTHHCGPSENEATVKRLVAHVLAYSKQPTAKNKLAVYNTIMSEGIAHLIDDVMGALVECDDIKQERLYDLAHSFAKESPDREPVKFGLAITGLFRQPADLDLYQILGRHEEFTLFSAVAIANTLEVPDDELWKLAKQVHGWGRIHVVQRLANSESEEIKDWLLREGFENSVMYEYLAAICARGGDLRKALQKEEIDRKLLTSAGTLIQALINGGPAENIDDYEDAPFVIDSYLQKMNTSAETIDDFLTIDSINDFLRDNESWSTRFESGWAKDLRDRCLAACDTVLAKPEWHERIKAQLQSTDEMEFNSAAQAAKKAGIDAWDVHWRRLIAEPTSFGRWFPIMFACDENRIDEVIGLAERSLDLERIATGASDEMGLGVGYEHHTCLDIILQELRRFPGKGEHLIQVGLKSSVTRIRNMAVAAIQAIDLQVLPHNLKEALQEAIKCEPNENTLEFMNKVLRGDASTEE